MNKKNFVMVFLAFLGLVYSSIIFINDNNYYLLVSSLFQFKLIHVFGFIAIGFFSGYLCGGAKK